METHVKVEVELDGGKKLTVLNHLSIVQRLNWHHTFELSLPLADVEAQNDNGFSQSQKFVGKPIKIAIAAVKASDTYNQFNGIVTDISIARHGVTAADLVIRGYSPTILLDDGENTKSFFEKSISQIVSDVTGNYSDLDVNASVSPDTKFDFSVQYRETNFAFLSRLADENGKWFYYDGKKVQFGKLTSPNKLDMQIGNDIINFDMTLRVIPLKFSDSVYDYVGNTVLKSSSSPAKVTGLDKTGDDLLNRSNQLFKQDLNAFPHFKVKAQSELKDITTSKKSALASNLVTISGATSNPWLKIGTKIDVGSNDLEKKSTSYGSFIVTSISHYADALGRYQGKFEAISANLTVPPANPQVVRPVVESQAAVVTDNADPDGYGRVKVKFFWQKDGESTPWIRLVTPHAGKNKGFQFIPEVEDEVLVGFEHYNPGRPYVLGALYHGKASHEDRKDKDNFIKTIRTVSGNEVKFYDKDGEEAILIQNESGQNQILLTLKDDGKITIKSKNKMELLAKEILIEAENKLTMKSDETTMQGKSKVDIASEQDCNMKGMNVKVESQQNLDVKAGAQGSLKATAGLVVDGGPQTSVKSSAMLELNGGAQATMKAGIVMIN